MNMEKGSSFDDLVAKNVPEDQKEQFLDEVGRQLMGLGSEIFEHEKVKTPEQVEMCKLADILTSEVRERYGLKGFSVPVENIHIFENNLNLAGLEVGGTFIPEHQMVFVREGNSRLSLMQYLCHELIHFKSYGAMQVPVGKEGIVDYHYRAGLGLRSRDAERVYFGAIDEALTEELAKRLVEDLKKTDNPLFIEEINETKRFLRYTASGVGNEEVDSTEDVISAYRVSDGADQTLVIRYVYKEQRKVLSALIDKIYKKNKSSFNNKEEVFNVFAKSKFEGGMLRVGKLIDDTFGKGTFRRLGEYNNDIQGLKEFIQGL